MGGEPNLIPPPPLPKDIPGWSAPLTVSPSPQPGEVSSSNPGLSLSGPESWFTDHADYHEGQLLTPPSDTSGSTKHLPAASFTASTATTTGQDPPQSSHWSEDSGINSRPSISTSPEAPPNLRQPHSDALYEYVLYFFTFPELAPYFLLFSLKMSKRANL